MKKKIKFALIGLAGYIAPKHLEAIKKCDGDLIYTHDISDAVGIIDKYFPNALFTTKYKEFKQWLKNEKIDYLVICTPNYLHYKHIKLGLKYCENVICEKPLVIKLAHLEKLMKYNKRINVILQMRLHPLYKQIKKHIFRRRGSKWTDQGIRADVFINYVAPRGDWYIKSWKGNTKKSGGLKYNIGIHLFDLMYSMKCDWFDYHLGISGESSRIVEVDYKIFDLSHGFDELHIKSYQEILKGRGFHVKDIKKVTEYIAKNK